MDMQNSGNVFWERVRQHRPLEDGWDMTGKEKGIVEEACPYILGTPVNDFIDQRIDDRRDPRYWEEAARATAIRLAARLNTDIATAIVRDGSQFYRTNDASGWDAITTAQVKLNERQLFNSGRHLILNDRDTQKYGKDLAARETINEIPTLVWREGMLEKKVAQFSVWTGSYLPNLAGGAATTTTTAAVSEKPMPGTVVNGSVVTNYDWRTATIAVTSSADFAVNDKVTFDNAGTYVKAIGLLDKSVKTDNMTFTIVAKPTGTSVTIFPKPIALNDAALSTLEKAYANINIQIANGANMTRVNIDASATTNLFFDKSAVTVLDGKLPVQTFNQFGGMKVVPETMKNGLSVYMLFDGDIVKKTFQCIIFCWYGITVNNPMNAGCFVTYT